MTILELVISISILITISSICIMKYEDDNYVIESFSRQLCSDMRYVRRENILNNKSVYIRFVNEDDKWCYILHNKGREYKKVFLPKDVDLSYPIGQNTSDIKFNNNGVCTNSGTITIKKDNKYRTITIVPASGRILYKEGIYEK